MCAAHVLALSRSLPQRLGGGRGPRAPAGIVWKVSPFLSQAKLWLAADFAGGPGGCLPAAVRPGGWFRVGFSTLLGRLVGRNIQLSTLFILVPEPLAKELTLNSNKFISCLCGRRTWTASGRHGGGSWCTSCVGGSLECQHHAAGPGTCPPPPSLGFQVT